MNINEQQRQIRSEWAQLITRQQKPDDLTALPTDLKTHIYGNIALSTGSRCLSGGGLMRDNLRQRWTSTEASSQSDVVGLIGGALWKNALQLRRTLWPTCYQSSLFTIIDSTTIKRQTGVQSRIYLLPLSTACSNSAVNACVCHEDYAETASGEQ